MINISILYQDLSYSITVLHFTDQQIRYSLLKIACHRI